MAKSKTVEAGRTRVVAALAAAALLMGIRPLPASAAPLEAYSRLPNIENASISPDGTRLALIYADAAGRKLVIHSLVGGKPIAIALEDTQVNDLQWVGTRHLIFTTASTTRIDGFSDIRGRFFFPNDVDLEAATVTSLLDKRPNGLNTIFDAPIIRIVDGKPTVFLIGYAIGVAGGSLSVLKVDPDTHETKIVKGGTGDIVQWMVGASEDDLGQVSYRSQPGQWSLRMGLGKDGFPQKVAEEIERLEPPQFLGLGRDGRSLLIRDRRADTIKELSFAGQWSDSLATADAWPVSNPEDGRLIGFHFVTANTDRYEFFDPKDQRVWDAIAAAYPGQLVSLVSWSRSHRKAVVLVDSPEEGPAFAFIDIDGKKADWLGAMYKLAADDISPVRPVSFKAQDGLMLSGYLTTPRGRDARGLPLIVVPHDFPDDREWPGFEWWSQALASRGYAVLRVNTRGSIGSGWPLIEAGRGQMGRKMQSDLSDGVAHLAAEGVIDPKRVCITGFGMGGYAALAGVALQQGIYRCAAAIDGMADPAAYAVWVGGDATQRYWSEWLGAQGTMDSEYRPVSPEHNAAKVTAPVLLVHGRDNFHIPFQQSDAMASALKSSKRPVELLLIPKTDRWFNQAARLQMVNEVISFLEKNNPPR